MGRKSTKTKWILTEVENPSNLTEEEKKLIINKNC